jgi:DUF1365 family protein
MSATLYRGLVTHQRHGAVRHRFSYRVFTLLLDIDTMPGLWLFRHNRAALFSFRDADHGERDGRPLRPWAERLIASVGVAPGGRIRILCFPRVLGFVFNPLTIYWCDDGAGRLAAIIYEVRNTFGGLHPYVLPVSPGRGAGAAIVQSCDKRFPVSPFIGMRARYDFRMLEPDARLSVAIDEHDADGRVLTAVMTGRASALTDGALLRAFFAYPLMTLKVIGAIHWQALRLWLKGVPLQGQVRP